ncbi:hypothetical protein G6F37_010330 [Rhizopus arrhizus]|nr:hypothetical protein G6F38_010416 [Rhizopus arrhizus]KAG1153472.1 hypothetical protein G6F37_010330 [Rhizopus arrhizus]
MRPLTTAMSGAFRASTMNPTYRLASKNMVLGSTRHFATQAPKKGGSKLLLATLLGVGAVAGLTFNQTKATVRPALDEAKAEAKPETTQFSAPDFTPLKLVSVQKISHDTSVFRFALPENQNAGLPVASCVIARHQVEGDKPIIRPYTPISYEDNIDHLDFVIKRYSTGKMTPVIHDMKPGDTLEFKGPIPKYDWEKDQKTNVGMIAGGTGITPMLQVIHRVFHEKSTDKKTKITLLFANVSENDILMKEELDKYAREHPDRFKVVYAVDKAPEGWTGVEGYITADVIKSHFPSPEDKDSIVMVCGPPPMVASMAGPKKGMKQGELSGILKELGYTEENVFKF